MKPSASDIALLRSRPHNTKLWLSIYQPSTVLACRVNDGAITKGEVEITYDSVTEGSYLLIDGGMTMYIGSTAGGDDKGKIRVQSATSTVLKVHENSIDWADGDYLTVVSFHEINAIYPTILQDPADETNTLWYKSYDIEYTDQNSVLGSFVCMGSHYAGFVEDDVYYSASGTSNLKDEALSYFWFFEGATVTGSNANTPGNRTYNTPGHYTTQLIVSGTASADVSYRHISIYDRPEDGTDNPILGWELINLGGTRDQGGYAGSIRIHDTIDEDTLKDGSLVVIFADDRYGTSDTSIGGNALNRSSIVFVGYIVDGTIRYNYRDSYVDFEVASPSEIMKQAEGFSVSVEDSTDPAGQAASDPNYPSGWVLLLNMDVRRAIYHYLKWHSTVMKCNDIEFLGTDKKIQYFDADRTSLFDAINTLMVGTLVGKVSSDRQGKLWLETDIYTEPDTFDEGVSIQNQDWMDDPFIEERNVGEVSFIESGGIYYTGITGSSTALLSVAPGSAPAYRGRVERMQGLALTGQAQLNTLTGNIFAFRNAKYPNIEFRLAGNYRNFDIAPQEKVPLTLAPGDTARNITFTDKNFFVTGLQYTYNSAEEVFLPIISLHELTTGVDADTSVIPIVPPVEGDTGGFSIPPITIPPIEIPPFPEISVPSTAVTWIPAVSGYNSTTATEIWFISGQGVELPSTDDAEAAGTGRILGIGDYSEIQIVAVVEPGGGASGNIYGDISVYIGDANGSSYSQFNLGDAAEDLTGRGNLLTAIGAVNFVSDLGITLSDYTDPVINVFYDRNGNHASDTLNVSVWVVGFILTFV